MLAIVAAAVASVVAVAVVAVAPTVPVAVAVAVAVAKLLDFAFFAVRMPVVCLIVVATAAVGNLDVLRKRVDVGRVDGFADVTSLQTHGGELAFELA